ncbi:MAG: bifunctional serine/threonine-protein kinase/formylglycine-generating enzyme family protein, partial [Nitrospirota bacterium]
MGAVYKAIDTKFETPCAVKELLPPMGDELEKAQAEDWFKREAKLLNKLDHPNLPKVFDYFISDGRYYLVMNYIEGEDLETILETHGEPGLPEEAVIEWAKQILEVLDYLHSQNPPIIYRDLKPGNIMIHKDGRVMLVDFGIARAIRKGSKTAKTAIGTEGYSPIEQCHGKPEARSDLYALGATMHHLLTGIDPIPFQFKPLTEIDPGFSPEMEIFIMKALEDEPQNRFSSAYEMLQILNSREKMKRIKLKSVKTASKPDVIKPDMLLIPGGTFQMGSGTGYTCKTPLHQVTLSAFLMSKYPVTNKEYCAFLNSMGNQNEKDVPWMDIVNDQYCGIRGGPDPGKFRVKMEYEEHPAVYVNWYGAVAYCNWLSEQEGLYPCYGSAENRGEPHVWRARDGYRLPTEAEWEYACR